MLSYWLNPLLCTWFESFLWSKCIHETGGNALRNLFKSQKCLKLVHPCVTGSVGHVRPLKRRCHVQSHHEWHLQMTVWHLDPVHWKNKSDSFISPLKLLSCPVSWGWSWDCCWFGLFYQFTLVTVALPGEIVGALRSLLILARLSHYLTFPLTWSPAVFQLRVVFWQHRLSAGELEWHFTLSPLWICAPTISLLFYFPFVVSGSILSWNRLLGCFTHPDS